MSQENNNPVVAKSANPLDFVKDSPYEAKVAIVDGKLLIAIDILKMANEGADHLKIPFGKVALGAITPILKGIKVNKNLDLIKDADYDEQAAYDKKADNSNS